MVVVRPVAAARNPQFVTMRAYSALTPRKINMWGRSRAGSWRREGVCSADLEQSHAHGRSTTGPASSVPAKASKSRSVSVTIRYRRNSSQVRRSTGIKEIFRRFRRPSDEMSGLAEAVRR